MSKAGIGAVAANATVRLSGSNVTVDVKIANGMDVPGSLSVFANGTSQHSDAAGTTVTFSFDNALAVGGYHWAAWAAEVSRESGIWWRVHGGAGNNLWFGRDDLRNEYLDDNAGQSHDILVGGAASDIIHAGNGFDFVDGGDGPGNDQLFGEAGNDILIGRKGFDYLEGGEGNDTYVFNRGDGPDWVYDDYRYMEPNSAGPTGAPSSGGGGSHLVLAEGGSDTLVFGPGIAVSDVSVAVSNNNLIVGVKDRRHLPLPRRRGCVPVDRLGVCP